MRCVEPQRGFTYVGLLVAVVIMGLMLTLVSRVWTTTEQREREIQLLYVGHAYRMAIASYYSTGGQFPTTLQQLVRDERFPVPKRHLRRLYPDPITGRNDWFLIPPVAGQPGIMGVASNSNRAPIKRDGFDLIDAAFKNADCYCDWQFAYYPRGSRSAVTGTIDTGSPAPYTFPTPSPSPAPTGPTTAPGVSLPPVSSPGPN
jgi:type II secretory pathway pseudopilin PulG